MGTELIEIVRADDQPLGYIIRSSFSPSQTTFVTAPEHKQQVGYVVYPAGGEVARHFHRPLERHLVGTSEGGAVSSTSTTTIDSSSQPVSSVQAT
jgi:hypothetical protein